jgi:AhpD family alkylhydroperoxidase
MRISAREPGAYPFYLKPFFWNQRRKYGAVLKAALLWARQPRLFMAVALLYGMIERKSSPLEPDLRSLVTVRVSQINWCRFCVDLNSATLLKRGAALEKVEQLENWRGSGLFTKRERVALAYAEAVTGGGAAVDDELFQELRKVFGQDAIVELTALIAFQNMSSKFNAALGVEPQGFCKVPPAPAA